MSNLMLLGQAEGMCPESTGQEEFYVAYADVETIGDVSPRSAFCVEEITGSVTDFKNLAQEPRFHGRENQSQYWESRNAEVCGVGCMTMGPCTSSDRPGEGMESCKGHALGGTQTGALFACKILDDNPPCETVQMLKAVASEAQLDAPFPLKALPKDCLAKVLSHCSFQDIRHFACVSKEWKEAAEEGYIICLTRVGRDLKEHFAQAFPVFLENDVATVVTAAMNSGVYTSKKDWMLAVDPCSCNLSLHGSSVKVLDLWWADGQGPVLREHQIRREVPGSNFPSCACVVDAQYFQLFGDVCPPFTMPSGWSTLSWRIAKTHRFVWSLRPASCSVQLLDGQESSKLKVIIQQDQLDYPSSNSQTRTKVKDNEAEDICINDGAVATNGSATIEVDFRHPGIGLKGSKSYSLDRQNEERPSVHWEVYHVAQVFLPPVENSKSRLRVHLSLRVSWFSRSVSGLYVDSFILTKNSCDSK